MHQDVHIIAYFLCGVKSGSQDASYDSDHLLIVHSICI